MSAMMAYITGTGGILTSPLELWKNKTHRIINQRGNVVIEAEAGFKAEFDS